MIRNNNTLSVAPIKYIRIYIYIMCFRHFIIIIYYYDLRVPSKIVILARVTRAFFFLFFYTFFLFPRHCTRRCRCRRHTYINIYKKRGRVSVACHSFNVTPVPICFRAPVFDGVLFYSSKCIYFRSVCPIWAVTVVYSLLPPPPAGARFRYLLGTRK